jgi:L-iditol 2-dehydrogenase
MNQAIFIHGARDVRLGEYQPPAPRDNETVLSIAAVGICGSDLHYYKDGGIGSAHIKTPFIPGHEFSGWLQQDIPALNLQAGELVAVDPATPCHQCEWCQRGYHNLCPQVKFIGAPPYQGALTRELTVPHSALVKLPPDISAAQAAMLEPLGVCVHALDLARVRVQESVAVIGCGGIGLGIIQLLANSSCGPVIAVDPQPHKVAMALEAGAAAAGKSLEVVSEYTGKRGCDLVIEATNSPDGFAHAIQAAAIGGRVVLVGIPDGDSYSTISASEARRRGLDIRFSRRMGDVYPRAIQLVSEQRANVDQILSHHLPLADTQQAFESQANNAVGLIKSMIYPGDVPAGVQLNSL